MTTPWVGHAATGAVVLASGGLDSCVSVALAAREGELALLHADYGQRTEQRERQAFSAIAAHYGIPPERRLVLDLHHLGALGGSALTDPGMAVPEANLTDPDIPVTYVPFRNANLLSAAVSWAEVLGAQSVYVGAVEEDSSGYPDCRREFFDAFERAIEVGTRPETHIRIVTPLIHLRKGAIVRQGIELGAPLHLTWSCYQREDRPCGQCDSCALRARGFEEAGTVDPLLSGRPEL